MRTLSFIFTVAFLIGMKLAVSQDLDPPSDSRVSSPSQEVDSTDSSEGKKIVVNLREHTWKAYDSSGELVKSGPVSGGKKWCSDIQSTCRTPTGEFTIQHKGGAGCKSGKFPIPNGGAPMPYCMFFHGGYALHGSYDVPGHHASHGCIRLLVKDAKWLNQEFVEMPNSENSFQGTSVVILPY